MTWSIRARLTMWYSLVVVIVLMAGAVAVAVIQQRRAVERLDREMQRLMLTLEGVMRTEFGEGLDLLAAAAEASSEVVAPDRTLALARIDGTLITAWGQPLPQGWRPPTASSEALGMIAGANGRARILSRPVSYAGHRYIAVVIAPLTELEAEYAELLRSLGAGVLVALLVAAAGGWIVGRQALQPLTDMAMQATAISAQDPSTRLHSPHRDDELGRLASAFNEVLDRLAASLSSQRQFMADASHELRTPVSVVRTTTQVALARQGRSEHEYREALTILEEQSGRLARLVEAMFLLSRAEAHGIPLVPEPLYLDDLVQECARAVRVLAAEREIAVQTGGTSEVAFTGDDMLLHQMVANLLDNAVRHAASAVRACITREPSGIIIRFTDDGPGIPPEDQARIFQRFVRLDSGSRGAGLGLPIARRIAEAHGGQLVLESSDSRGSCFSVTLPSA
jgi:signal transduction histidine kinase